MEENTDQFGQEMRSSVQMYEEMMRSKVPHFFDVTAFENIIQYYEQRELWKKAIEVSDIAIEQHPFSSWFLIKKAGLLLYYRKYREAMKLLDEAEKLDPNDIDMFILRADVFVERGMHKEAVRILQFALHLTEDEFDRVDLLLELADVYEDSDQFSEMFTTLREILLQDPANEEALSRMWYCVELSGKYEESIELHKELLDRDAYNYLAWHNLGHAYFDLGLFEKAIDAYEFVAAIHESSDLAWRDLGDCYFHLKQYGKAIEQYQKAITISKPYEDLYFSIGFCYELMNNFSLARKYFKKVIASEPKYDEAYYRLGETYSKERNWKNALLFYQKALRIVPDHVTYLMAVAKALSETNHAEELIDTVTSILNLNSRAIKKNNLEKLVQYLLANEIWEEAMVLMDYSEQERGSFPNFPYYRFIAFWHTGKRREAQRHLEEGLSNKYEKKKLIFKFAPALAENSLVSQLLEQYKPN
jgi:tetratricopeptide (TPR) repeat protein